MDVYKNKINFGFATNQKILNLIGRIDLYKGRWSSIEKQENIYLKELRRIATIESVGSSTRIEGAILTDDEIEELFKNLKISKLKTRDQQEVIGYYETLDIIYENFKNIELSENYIKQLHQNLLKHSNKDERHRGSYKNLSNKVVAKYPDGTQKVIFNTTDAHLVEKEINDLLNWTNSQLNNTEIHALIVIGLFIYEFLSIHPFQDGNGRLSRLLTTLLLLKTNYHFVQYVSFENLIEKSKKTYYNALMNGQKDRNTKKEIISDWIVYFLDKINLLTEKLETKYDLYKTKAGYLNERQKVIKMFIEENQPVKVSDISKRLKEVSINTIKKDLQYMKSEQIIKSIGIGKGTVYLAM